MAWRFENFVLEGELDNTQLGWTTGWLRLEGRDDRLQLKLAGNCHPDLAGWKFRIQRTDPIPEWAGEPNFEGLATDQSGNVGDITASQMLKHFECSTEEFLQRHHAGEPVPTELRKSLYLEWYSNFNGRVVVQSTRLAVEKIGEQAFELTEENYVEQARQNAEEMNFFMTQLGEALSQRTDEDDDESNNASL